MRRWGVALLALAACSTPRAVDEVAGEVRSPAHVTLKVREYDEPTPCTKTGVDRLRCLFEKQSSRCAWVEVDGAPLAAAEPMGVTRITCEALPIFGARVRAGHAYPVELVGDPTGERVIVHDARRGAVLYLFANQVVARLEIAWPAVWARVPTLADVLPNAIRPADPISRALLIAHARSRGADAVTDLMEKLTVQFDTWQLAYFTLEEDERQRALVNLHTTLREAADPELALTLLEHAHLQPEDFADIMARGIETAFDAGRAGYELAPLIRELHLRNDRRAGPLACRVFGSETLATLSAGHSESLSAEAGSVLLAVIARTKTPCPWVLAVLQEEACSSDLRCDAEARRDEPSEDEAQLPLCDARAVERALDRWADDHVDESVLLAAAYAQGPLPPEIVLRNARRQYRVIYPPFDDVPGEERPCHPDGLAEVLCRLPLTVTDLDFAGCRMDVDDRRRVVRVERLKPPK